MGLPQFIDICTLRIDLSARILALFMTTNEEFIGYGRLFH